MTLADAAPVVEAVRLRVTAHHVPEADPPYDDGEPPARLVPAVPLAPYPEGLPSSLRLVPSFAGDALDDFGSVRTPRGRLEDPLPRAAMLARALLEAAAGLRPIGQLVRWVSPDVLALLHTTVANRGPQQQSALRRVLVSEPLPGVAEVTALVQRGSRTEAMALRMDGLDGRWLVTAWEQP